MTGRPRESVYDCEAIVSYRFKNDYDRVEYVLFLESEVDRLTFMLRDENGERVAWELQSLESDVERLRGDLAAKAAEVERLRNGGLADELRVENARLRLEVTTARTEATRAWARSAEVESLRAQVSNLIAVAPGGRWRPARASVVEKAEEVEVLSDRGRWAGLELA